MGFGEKLSEYEGIIILKCQRYWMVLSIIKVIKFNLKF